VWKNWGKLSPQEDSSARRKPVSHPILQTFVIAHPPKKSHRQVPKKTEQNKFNSNLKFERDAIGSPSRKLPQHPPEEKTLSYMTVR